MAKSAAPLVLALGAGALIFGTKKKKKSSESSSRPSIDVNTAGEHYEGSFDPNTSNAFLVLDQECMEIAKKINPSAHNTYITNRFHQLVSEGWADVDKIALRILKDQSEHCPWEDPNKWTPMMKGLFQQLRDASAVYYESLTGAPAPEPASTEG